MKKVSAKMFFTVVWSGVCQALGWFFGLFGYKRDGKFAKCVWGLFATSAAVVTSIIAITVVCVLGEEGYRRYIRGHQCNYDYCYHSEYIAGNIYFHNTEDGKGYIFNKLTREITLRRVSWIAKPYGKDSLVCYSDGKKRGYFSKYSGKVVIPSKYNHAWVFSCGLAGVEEGGYIKFIDATGKVVIDKKMPYFPNVNGFVFHNEYCVVRSDNRELCGLMDKKGNLVLPMEYKNVSPSIDEKLWLLYKDGQHAVLNSELQTVIPLTECTIAISDGTIDLTMPDHTMREYDLQGNLLHDFCFASVRMLEYEKEEIIYRKNATADEGDGNVEEKEEYYHPKATARLRAYVAGDGYEGLMTADGRKVTMPLYWEIEALDQDLYLCASKDGDKVIVNGKGEIVN